MCASFEIAGCFLFITSYNGLQKNISVYEWHLYHPHVAYLANTLHPSLRVVERFNARVYFESQEKYSADSEMRFTADEDVPLVVISPVHSTMCKKVYRKGFLFGLLRNSTCECAKSFLEVSCSNLPRLWAFSF